MKLICAFFWTLLAAIPAIAQNLTPLRPPAVPLILHDPYFSVWSAADHLNDAGTTHWTGKPNSLSAAVRVDGKVANLIGAAGNRRNASAAPLLPDLNARLHPSDSTPWTILLVLTLITLLPAIVMCMTPLVRLLVVFHFLRQALGTQTAPSNPTLLGLALMMTWFLMTPVLNQVDQQAVEPYRAGQVTGWEAIDRGAQPVKRFLLRYAREKDLALFTAAGQIPRPNTADDLPMRVVVPAYILSELKAGFSIGAVLFLPFLLIDMVTASITTSIGMFQLPPVVVSTPLKILLFVMVDGWNLLANSLLRSF